MFQRTMTIASTAPRRKSILLVSVTLAVLAFALAGCAASPTGLSSSAAGSAGASAESTTRINLALDGSKGAAGIGVAGAQDPQQLSVAIQMVAVLTVLALAPALLVMVTSFTRIIVVLGFIRTALGVPQMPPNQVLIGLGLFLTLFVMTPTADAINQNALQPYQRGEISQEAALSNASKPLRDFMLKQTREKDLALFLELSHQPRPNQPDDVPLQDIVPAFVISELKTAFQMGFVIFIPFLVIDMVISSALMSMGMMMLPPAMISLPFKLLLFVLVDGWYLVVGSLVKSFT
jgi:flagellar biosynthesis protein FliP